MRLPTCTVGNPFALASWYILARLMPRTLAASGTLSVNFSIGLHPLAVVTGAAHPPPRPGKNTDREVTTRTPPDGAECGLVVGRAGLEPALFGQTSCAYVNRIYDSNKIWFDTIDEAKKSGRRGCYVCSPAASSGASGFYSDTSSEYSDRYDDGYDDGYSAGLFAGKKEAQSEIDSIKKQAKNDAKSSSSLSFSLAWILLLTFMAWYLSSRERKSVESEPKKENASLRRAISLRNGQDQLPAGNVPVQKDVEMPEGITLEITCTPIKGSKSAVRPYGDYTVYTSKSGAKYHCKRGCCKANSAMHIFDACHSYSPCSICVPPSKQIREIPDWYRKINESVNN